MEYPDLFDLENWAEENDPYFVESLKYVHSEGYYDALYEFWDRCGLPYIK